MSNTISSNWNRLQQSSTSRVNKQQRKKQSSFKKAVVETRLVGNGITEETTKITKQIDANNQQQEVQLESSRVLSPRQMEIGKYLAVDCEMVGIVPNDTSVLARVSIVNYHGHVIYDTFVKPSGRVMNWRTRVSGVRGKDMKNAVPFRVAQKTVADFFKNRVIIGHAIQNDLDVLELDHPKSMIRDTSKHQPFREKYSAGKTPSLKTLTKEILGKDIQGGQHSSVEDAKATMEIFKSDRAGFEREVNRKFR